MTVSAWNRPVNAILFDLDGTLLHTAPDITAAINRMLLQRSLPAVQEALVTNMIGRGSPILIERVFNHLGIPAEQQEPDAALKSFQEAYDEIAGTHARPFPGVADGLAELRAMGLKLAVVTNKYQRFATRLMQQFGFSPLIDLLVGGDTLPKRKPDPMPLLHACEVLGTSPANALYVGDSPVDVAAATAAGIPVFCVPYGYREGKPVTSLECDGFIASLQDIPALLTGKPDTASRKFA